MLDINDIDIIKYGICNLYEIDPLKITNLKITDNSYDFDIGDNKICSIQSNLLNDYLNKIKSIGNHVNNKDRVGIILNSEIIDYFLSTYYIEYRLLINFIKLLNYNNIGVDIITDKNIAYILPPEINEYDINIYFDPNNIYCETSNIEDKLINSINYHYKRNTRTIKYLSSNILSLKALTNCKVPINKKIIILHSQKILNYPKNDMIRTDDVDVINLLVELKNVDFTIITTSEILQQKLQEIYPNKIYDIIYELGYQVKDVEEKGYNQRKNDLQPILCNFSTYEDLQYLYNAIKPLNSFLCILYKDEGEYALIQQFMNKNQYTNYILINKDNYDIIKYGYNLAIDFSDKISINYNCKVIVSNTIDDINNNFIKIDKTNNILLIKNILLNTKRTVNILDNNSSFKSNDNITENMCKQLKQCMI